MSGSSAAPSQSQLQGVTMVGDQPSEGFAPQSAPRRDRRATRDRIVVLGRRQAGKTVYLSTLYAKLWRATQEPFVRSLDGRTHEDCMAIVEAMRERSQFPQATQGSKYFDLEVTYRGRSRPLVSLDYPGEVFRKAFVTGERSADVEELLDHVDGAAGVIALVDPAVVAGGNAQQAADDEYGLVRALERIRGRPGGERAPVALVLTKYDLRYRIVHSNGGPVEFVNECLWPVIRSVPDLRVFTCTAVQQDKAPEGVVIRQNFAPRGVVEPLVHVLDHIESEEREEARARQRQEVAQAQREQRRMDEKSRRSRIRTWTLVWLAFISLVVIAGFLTWWAVNR